MFDPVRRSIPDEPLGNNSLIPVENLDVFQERLALAIDKFSVGSGIAPLNSDVSSATEFNSSGAMPIPDSGVLNEI